MLVAATFLAMIVAGHGATPLRLTGTVEDPTSVPIPGASVTLLSVNTVLHTNTLQSGSFAFGDVPPGAYEVIVEICGFFRKKLSLDIHENAPPVPLVIRPEICMATGDRVCGPDFPVIYGPFGTTNSHLRGVIYHFGGPSPIANAEVTLKRADDAPLLLRSHSDRTGRFTFENVPGGIYDVTIAKRGYQPVRVKRLIKPRGHDLYIETALLERGIVVVEQ